MDGWTLHGQRAGWVGESGALRWCARRRPTSGLAAFPHPSGSEFVTHASARACTGRVLAGRLAAAIASAGKKAIGAGGWHRQEVRSAQRLGAALGGAFPLGCLPEAGSDAAGAADSPLSVLALIDPLEEATPREANAQSQLEARRCACAHRYRFPGVSASTEIRLVCFPSRSTPGSARRSRTLVGPTTISGRTPPLCAFLSAGLRSHPLARTWACAGWHACGVPCGHGRLESFTLRQGRTRLGPNQLHRCRRVGGAAFCAQVVGAALSCVFGVFSMV